MELKKTALIFSQNRAARSHEHGHAATAAIPARPAPRLAPPTAGASTNQRGGRRAPKGAGSEPSLHAEKARSAARCRRLGLPPRLPRAPIGCRALSPRARAARSAHAAILARETARGARSGLQARPGPRPAAP